MTRSFFLISSFLGLLLPFLGCSAGNGSKDGAGGEGNGGGDIGAPCELEEHCASGLICDIHGDHGSCQEPHDH